MILSILAIAVLIGSTLLILGNLRMVMRDIYDVLLASVAGARFTNHMVANVAFVALWLMLFALSFG